MSDAATLKVATPGDREIVLTRAFNAPRQLVFDAFTKPELLKRWLFGLPGWSLAVCEIDLTVGGSWRYVWRGPDGAEMGMTSVLLEIDPPERIVTREKWDQAWYPGEAVGTIVLIEKDGKTTLTHTLRYPTPEGRDIALQSAVEGMEMGYGRLDQLFSSPEFGQ
jgi:uncharacterized protein YndB with AHSA1/START domain